MNFEHNLEVFVREVLQNSLDARQRHRPLVRVVFALECLRGAAKKNFLETAGWRELKPHLDAARPLAPSFTDALERLDDVRAPLHLLAIHDGPAVGLSGPERGQGRFAMFARNKLLSDKQSRDAGGSFGLGKSVLWAHSGISTIFVHSHPVDSAGLEGANRFIGIAQLPSHNVGSESFDGPGWLGKEQDDGAWSSSCAVGAELLEHLRLTRAAELDTGTSIVVPDFMADGDVAEVAEQLSRAAAKWFWPAIVGPERCLEVEIVHGGQRRTVDPTQMPELRPFVHLAGLAAEPAWAPRTVTGEQALKLPGVCPALQEDPDFTFHDGVKVSEAIRLDAITLEEYSGDLKDTMALMRGAKMVVTYLQMRCSAPSFALARAGTAHGNSREDQLVEQFLRHAEPPSHDAWSASAPKLHDRYKPGYKGELGGLGKRLVDAALVLLRKQEAATGAQEIPAVLRKVLSVPVGDGRGEGGREGRFDHRITSCRLVARRDEFGWEFSGWAQNTRGGHWILEAEGWLECDGGRIPLPVERLRVEGASTARAPNSLSLVGDGRIKFSGFCPISELGRLAERAVFGVQMKRRSRRARAETRLHEGGS